MLGIPVATTFSHATREYVAGRSAILEAAPGDAPAFSRLAERLIDEASTLREAAGGAIAAETLAHGRQLWADYLNRFVQRHAGAC